MAPRSGRLLLHTKRQLLLLLPMCLALAVVVFLALGTWELVVDTDRSALLVPTAENTDTDLPQVHLEDCAARFFEANYMRSLRETSIAERDAAHLRHVGVDHVYIIHYTPLRYRRGNLTAMLQMHGVTGEWVTGFDKEVLNETTDHCFHYFDAHSLTGAKSSRYVTSGLFPKPLGPAQRSVVVKHFSALYDAYRHNYQRVLVLEDDVLLRAGFVSRLGEVVRDTPPGFDAIFVGGCMRFYAWRRKTNSELITKHIYRKQSSRCAHAFVLSQAGVRKLLRSLPLTEPIDFQMNLAMREEKMTVYWVEPWMSVQGQFGEATCVTKTDLKDAGSCRFSTLQRYSQSFDLRYVNDTEVLKRWENVPAFRSVR
ncbi:hypothetical protein DQ04_03771040 [Trypanosoma grayi]|uniref:hypothetical protein n=1 Tax=Trypanosoma grayi TaxID=71804 RepID=UPI0004F4629D|nr:hypothetical protein DQ04_03771040 [Trypanosoma grayi]KEG10388.1 hypothetical protein DQ04_03771040 [Trypanosoma grayi]